MKLRFTALLRALPLVLIVAVSPLVAQEPQGRSPIDDLLRRAQDAFNDLNYPRADSIARSVLNVPRISAGQRNMALMVMAAAAYPEEKSAQKRASAMAALKQVFRGNLTAKIPAELTWPGLDSLAEEARRNSFGVDIAAEKNQVLAGPSAKGTVRFKSNHPAYYRFLLTPVGGGTAVAYDSVGPVMAAEFQFDHMRYGKPLFTTGTYDLIMTAVDSVSRDTVVSRYVVRVDAPSMQFIDVPVKLDSTKFLVERTGGSKFKSIIPALFVGGAVFALSNVLRAEGPVKTTYKADSKGVGVAGGLALGTIIAGFLDRGRAIPANIAANRAYADAFAKSVQDAQAENSRRIAEYKTTIIVETESR